MFGVGGLRGGWRAHFEVGLLMVVIGMVMVMVMMRMIDWIAGQKAF